MPYTKHYLEYRIPIINIDDNGTTLITGGTPSDRGTVFQVEGGMEANYVVFDWVVIDAVSNSVIPGPRTQDTLTLYKVYAYGEGNKPDVPINIYYGTPTSTTLLLSSDLAVGEVEISTTGFNISTLNSNSWLRLKIGTISGTSNRMTVCLYCYI